MYIEFDIQKFEEHILISKPIVYALDLGKV